MSSIDNDNFRPFERVAFAFWVASIWIPFAWLVWKFLTEGKSVMKFAVLTFVSLLALAPVTRADVIQGGTRQQYDAVHCSAYRPVWDEFNRYVPSIPTTYQYGPEAVVPVAPADSPISEMDPIATAAVNRWMLFASLDAIYAGAGAETTREIGYDQLYVAYSIVDESLVGQTGPQLPMPKLAEYLPMTPEHHRAWTIAVKVWSLSFYRVLSEFQLRAIHVVMLETPTCGGVGY